jgi:hypothetical protein
MQSTSGHRGALSLILLLIEMASDYQAMQESRGLRPAQLG